MEKVTIALLTPAVKCFRHYGWALAMQVVLIAAMSLGAAAETLVKPESTTSIEICPSCTAVHVLLVPDNKSKIKLDEDPKVEAVYFNGTAPRKATKFSSKWTGKPFPRVIAIILDEDEMKQSGTYDLYLNLQPDSDPGAGRLKIQLTRPAASLEAIPKLIIDRTYWFIAWSSDSHPDLRVTEVSKKSIIMISGIRPVSNSVIGTKPIGGTLGFAQMQPEIKPGDQATLDYTLKGNFELGIATGTMKIDAPQLASPVPFDFEVRSRVHWIWIGITIIVALFISWLLKVKLQKTIELDQAKLDAKKLVERIAREAEHHADPHFALAYQPQLEQLRNAMNGISASDINTFKLELDKKWQKALQDFEKKHQDANDALDKLHDITQYDWLGLVPPDIDNTIKEARTAHDKVLQLIERDDLSAAQNKLKNTIFKLGSDIKKSARSWQICEQKIIKTIQEQPLGIPAAISAELAKSTTDVLASVHKVDENTKLDTLEQIKLTLDDLKSERAAVKGFFDWLSLAIQMILEKATEQIPMPPPTAWNVAIFDEVRSRGEKFTTFLKTMVDKPNGPELSAQLKKVHQDWTDALQNQFTQPNGLVKMQLDARDYVQATAVAVQQKTEVGAAAATPPQLAGPAFIAPPFYRDTAGAGPPIYAIHTRYHTFATPAPVVPTSVTLEKKLKMDKGIQSFILGILLVVAGYGLQLNTFVGTFTDFSTLFFWAFALDLTVDQVRVLTKKT